MVTPPSEETPTDASHQKRLSVDLSLPARCHGVDIAFDVREIIPRDKLKQEFNGKLAQYGNFPDFKNDCRNSYPSQVSDTSPILEPISTISLHTDQKAISDVANCAVKFEEGTKTSADKNSEKDSICSSSPSSKDHSEKTKVPDGGWGWVVVIASLVISMIADGVSFSFGLLFIQLLDHFGESKSKTSWIGSLFMAVPLLSGPVGSALVDRYGCRWMTIIGGIVSGIGLTLSAFADSVEMLYITFGLIAGLGLGLCYVTAIVSIAYWFDKKRTLATGLGSCGTGIGTFIYAPMTTYFIEEYGWRGTTLLLAGTFFNMCVCGALMRDPDWLVLEQRKQATSHLYKSGRASSSCASVSGRSDNAGDFPGVDGIRKMLSSGHSPEYVLTTLAANLQDTDLPPGESEVDGTKTPAYSSVVNLPTFIHRSEKVPLEVLESLCTKRRVFSVIMENYPSLLSCRSMSDKGINKLPVTSHSVSHRIPVSMEVHIPKKEELIPACEYEGNDAEKPTQQATSPLLPNGGVTQPINIIPLATGPSNYLKGIRMHRNSVMYRGAMLKIHKYRLRASSCPDIYRNSMTTIAKETEEKWYSDILDLLRDIVDFSMFLELHFLFTSLSTILLFTWFIVPYFYLADYMMLYGYTENEASLLLSIIGLTNCIGMIALGWAGDKPWVNVTKSYALCLVMCGVATGLMPLVITSYWMLALLSALFGLFFASSFSFTPAILVQLIPLDRFTTAYGLMLLCEGIGNLLGPPLGGLVFDLTGYWDLSFYLAGVWIVLSGILIALIPITKNQVICGKGTLELEKEQDQDSVDVP
ncbi:uncharacterized protein LOC126237506 isoform X1 [Schistocerca nitens]|uniref:uncharacterized protein LOC126237506 isoform X1 n=1 Tax=Schistocerca nitens TaxID=7011 RepID=UPI0021175E7B|nr:uncharacterized protein LOC126237506 isoform X1 [Schistocerca nitens]XP_049803621.1 uncharacterized protein LOC126237506 isoform X1 [Schistocerca nitens]XP_049803622.1 uncharacterized protein LOC126237506 isoform X1 [Schistocerca nitens]